MGDGTLILPYIRRLRPFLGVQILNFIIFGGCQKDEYFCGLGWGLKGYDETVDISRGPLQNRTIFGSYTKHSRAIFFRSRYRIGIFLGGC